MNNMTILPDWACTTEDGITVYGSDSKPRKDYESVSTPYPYIF